MSVYGLKLRRTDPSDSVVSMSTYAVSSTTSMLRRHRLTMPVIDRGPYGGNGAQWDLTAGAARALGMTDTARIATRVVGSAPNSPTLGQPPAIPAIPIAASTGGISAG